MSDNRMSGKGKPRTPAHAQLNRSDYVFNRTTKFRSPNLPRKASVNETICCKAGPAREPDFKCKRTTNFGINYEVECDSAYNDYLQALMKQQLVEIKAKEQEQVLEDQLLVQSENICKRQQSLKEMVVDMENYKTKSEIVEIINILQEHFISFVKISSNYDIKTQLHQFKSSLNLECDKVVLRNIRALENQDEYEKFIKSLESCVNITEKVVTSGRDFQEVHNFAEKIRKLENLITTVNKSREALSEIEKEAMYGFLQYVSNFFANQYFEN